MKILLVGSTGMLGRILYKKFTDMEIDLFSLSSTSQPEKINHFATDLKDISGLNDILNKIKPDIIINAAAITNLNFCETNPDIATALHVNAVKCMSECPSLKKMIHFSTDSVYPGKIGNHSENDKTNPLNIYAATKLAGEKFVWQNNHIEGLVLRVNILGSDSSTHTSLFEWAYNSLSNNQKISGYSNVYFNPLYVGDLADLVVQLLKSSKPMQGLYNLGSNGQISKFALLKMIQEFYNFDENLLESINMEQVTLGIERPVNTTMNITKALSLFENIPTTTETILKLMTEYPKKMADA